MGSLILDDIINFDRHSLIEFIRFHSVESDLLLSSTEETDELQSKALSILLNPIELNEFKFNELKALFTRDDEEMLRILYESTNFKFNQTMLVETKELFCRNIEIMNSLSNKRRIPIGTLLIAIEEETTNEERLPLKNVIKFSCSNIVQYHYFRVNVIATKCLYFGYTLCRLHFNDQSQATEIIMCTTPVYNYIYQLELFLDLFYWGYGSGPMAKEQTLCVELENSLLELCIHVNEELVTKVQSWMPMLTMVGGAGSSGTSDMVEEINKMIQTIQSDVASALSEHSLYAIGRLHQTLGQLLEIGLDGMSMLSLPQPCVDAIFNFIILKTNLSYTPQFGARLVELIHAVEQYLATFQGNHSAELSRLSTFLSIFQMRQAVAGEVTFSDTEIRSIGKDLRPRPIEMMSYGNGIPQLSSTSVVYATYMPVIPLAQVSDISMLDRLGMAWSQSLVGDMVQVGSMLGTSLGSTGAEQGASIITSLLEAGFTYVCSASGKIMSMFPVERSVLCLGCDAPPGTLATHIPDPSPPRQLVKRIKDMPRLFRNQKLHRLPKLSLRVNTNFDLAIALLRAHHGDDCWIGRDLEVVWRHMASTDPPQLVVFELWLGEEEMIAADFGHFCAGGHSFYVATRFFNREHPNQKVRQMQPGFILGLSECHLLRSLGCLQWDLGGVNLCPLMRYKIDLTGEPMERPVALAYFRQFRQYGVDSHPIGHVHSDSIAISDITFEHVKIF